MTDQMTWDEQVAHDREVFIDGMVAKGFRLVRDDSVGLASDTELRNGTVRVALETGFPYLPPSVFVEIPVKRSWHLERTNKMCLYTSADRDTRPWEDPEALCSRIDEWLSKNEQGWENDLPVLDLEAYLDMPIDMRRVVFDHLDRHDGDPVTLAGNATAIRIVSKGRPSKKSRKAGLAGFVTNIGEIDEPVYSLDEVLERSPDSSRIRHGIRVSRLAILLVRYSRNGHWGAVAITFDQKGGPHRALVASADSHSRALRAGPAAPLLAEQHVYVIGVGALGSHIADGLVRAGIGRLTLRDGDEYVPGNASRHIVALNRAAGMSKPTVLKQIIESRSYCDTQIMTNNASLTDPSETTALFGEASLVVDATADGSVLAMLSDAAASVGARFVTVFVQNEGRSMRLDLVPPLNGASPLPPTALRTPRAPERFEAGCGEPVSPTPPFAVAEAAAMAVRHICGMLIGDPLDPSGELREW